MPTAPRAIARVVRALRTVQGGGFAVRRPLLTAALTAFDPFRLLDEMGPVDCRCASRSRVKVRSS